MALFACKVGGSEGMNFPESNLVAFAVKAYSTGYTLNDTITVPSGKKYLIVAATGSGWNTHGSGTTITTNPSIAVTTVKTGVYIVDNTNGSTDTVVSGSFTSGNAFAGIAGFDITNINNSIVDGSIDVTGTNSNSGSCSATIPANSTCIVAANGGDFNTAIKNSNFVFNVSNTSKKIYCATNSDGTLTIVNDSNDTITVQNEGHGSGSGACNMCVMCRIK